MKCEDFRPQLVEYLDDEPARPEREKLAAHLHACPDCRELAQKLEQSLAVFQAVAPLESPAGQPAAEALELPRLSWWRRRRLFWMAAAGLVMVAGGALYLGLHPALPSRPAGPALSQNLAQAGSEQTFVYHGQGISRQNSLDLKL
jgi:anti-sigma factor RsiW